MPRPADSKRRSIAAIVAALLLLIAPAIATPPPPAAASSPAEDEYVLEMPGVQGTDELPPGADRGGSSTAAGGAGQLGVAGEREHSTSAVAAAGDALTSSPAIAVALLLCLAAAIALIATTRSLRAVAAALAAGALAIGAAVAVPGCGGGEEEAPADFYGIAPQGELNESDYSRMAAGGVDTYHLLLSWPAVERERGRYDWSRYDGIVGRLAVAGLEPLPYVFGTAPPYADDVTDAPTSSPEALAAWAGFLRAAASRYGPGGDFWTLFERAHPGLEPRPLHTWEIWNEPNSSVFWTPRPDPADYASLLVRSARALRSVDDSASVMSGGMFATPQSRGAITSFDFLRDMYARPGVSDAVDIVGLHPYGPDVDAVVDQVERTRSVVDEAGDDGAALWVTEVGWGSKPSGSSHLATTPERQAQLLGDTLSTLLERREDWDLRGVIWFTWHDTKIAGNPCGWCASAGLLDQDRDPKPSWDAFTALTGGNS